MRQWFPLLAIVAILVLWSAAEIALREAVDSWPVLLPVLAVIVLALVIAAARAEGRNRRREAAALPEQPVRRPRDVPAEPLSIPFKRWPLALGAPLFTAALGLCAYVCVTSLRAVDDDRWAVAGFLLGLAGAALFGGFALWAIRALAGRAAAILDSDRIVERSTVLGSHRAQWDDVRAVRWRESPPADLLIFWTQRTLEFELMRPTSGLLGQRTKMWFGLNAPLIRMTDEDLEAAVERYSGLRVL